MLVPRRPTSRLPREGSPWYPLSPDVLGVPVEFTALWNGRFRRETLTAQVFAFYTPGADLWLNPALTYAVRDALNAALGLQVFAGAGDDEESLSGLLREPAPSFATYDRNDFAYLRVSYSF